MKNYNIILIAFLVGITIFSIFKYTSSLKEKTDLTRALKQIKGDVAALENEKQTLLQEIDKEKQLQQQLNEENTGLKESLRASEEKLAGLNADFAQTQKVLEQLNSQVGTLKEENAALNEEKDKLSTQLADVTQEKDDLKARLNSIAELKKAIRELKRRMRNVSVEVKHKIKRDRINEGNYGFLIREGKSTYPSRVKIKVIPFSAVDAPVLENK